ncbi:hypothetical protein SERLA73DRAFT_189165 [Serpula lacrymans var. lacrymans S7.3]|uniref:Uncharacterized protein n=2 Tax=Serpula lacrymans var. lacrymans TaxID=341189 RepID=F8QCY9_SERL3|nr:uncharacterized protein SERLADRAFT_479869 [Serpula lacrymans var. lacrymans S7.9]EGN94004.1 hypothetical protein SERLA73DRAFT_189165 [Serpula lacrymans var. lacrymans S7.3]EGO19363.1 hypothetical protein SERLADRAFT_479869 [Serpula lacrymans var. lacrymans S7.9]
MPTPSPILNPNNVNIVEIHEVDLSGNRITINWRVLCVHGEDEHTSAGTESLRS